MDGDSNDFANGFSLVVTRDGQGPASTFIKVNGVGATPYSTAIGAASSVLVLNKHGSGNANNVFGASDGLFRWTLNLGNTTLEAGANVGSDLTIGRYNDSGTFVDFPISIARSTGLVTISSLNVLGGITAPISSTNGTFSGFVTVGTTLTVTGVATFNASPLYIIRPSGQQALIDFQATRHWQAGEQTDGTYIIFDATAGVSRLTIGTTGAVTIPGSTTVTGALIGSTNIQCNVAAGGNALHYGSVATVRQWYWGVLAAGGFTITDATGGVARLSITTAGAATFTGNLTCSGNFNTNQITGSTIIASGGNLQCNVAAGQNALLYLQPAGQRSWYIGGMNNSQFYITDNSLGAVRIAIDTAGTVNVQQALWVGTTSTLNGTVSCNAISCSTINTNGNTITAGPINCGTISCSTITSSDIVHCVHGVQYSDLGNHCIGFNNSGGTLTFFAFGGTTASWTFTVSDERLKENIAPARGDALDEVRRLKLISFDLPYPDAPTRHFDNGFSAQQMQGIIPEAVVEANHARADEEKNMVLSLDVVPLLARCVGAIQQLADRIEALEGRSQQWT